MNDAGVPEAVLVLLSFGDRIIDVATTNERHERHHLLNGNEWIELIRFTEQQLCVSGYAFADALSEHGGVFAEKIFRRSVMVVVTDLNDGDAGELSDFGSVQSDGSTDSFHRAHHLIENRIDDEDFFLGDAQEIVIKRSTFDDAASCSLQVGSFVDDNGRISWSGNNRSLARFQSCSGNGRAACDADQFHVTMVENHVR